MNVSPPVRPVVSSVVRFPISLADLTKIVRLMTETAEAGRPCPVQIQK